MSKKIVIAVLSVIILSIFQPVVAQTVKLGQEKVVYNLPYPGILPDNPLYFIKASRDKIVDVGTRDHIKKAELYLLYADKRAAMALSLTNKGKDKLAIATLSKGEKYFLKIPQILITSKKQGVGYSQDLLSKLKLSNTKHKEVAQEILKKIPQGQAVAINEIIKLNELIKSRLNSL